jgi:hypothetical protein
MAKSKMSESVIPEDVLLDGKIILALETAPLVDVPAGFAARVVRQLPPRPELIMSPVRYGQRATIACLVFLVILILNFAHRATGSSLYWFSIESILCGQFALLTVWLVVRSYTSASSF